MYFEDWNRAPNAEFGPKDNLETAPKIADTLQAFIISVRIKKDKIISAVKVQARTPLAKPRFTLILNLFH